MVKIIPMSASKQTSRTLALVPHYAVEGDKGAVLIHLPGRTLSLRGGTFSEILPLLVPLLDGTRTEAEIFDSLNGSCDSRKARAVLQALAERNLVEASNAPRPLVAEHLPWESVRRYLANPVVDSHATLAKIRAARVVVAGPSRGSAELQRVLLRSGVGRVEAMASAAAPPAEDAQCWERRLRDATLAVVVGRRPVLLSPALEAINAAALKLRIPWLNVNILGPQTVQLGPTFIPNVTGCFACLVEHFRDAVRSIEAYPPFQALVDASADIESNGPVHFAMGVAATETLRILSGLNNGVSMNRIVTFDLGPFRTSHARAPRVPRCLACGPTRNRPRMRVWS
jgi:bacteriocin biosynthesis cyclodehydratase domain-containing protein